MLAVWKQPPSAATASSIVAGTRLANSLPTELALDVQDAGGEVTITNTSDVNLRDGGGPVYLGAVKGSVEIDDGAGDITLKEIGGEVRITDGSGQIGLTKVGGSVHIDDGSGAHNVDDMGYDGYTEQGAMLGDTYRVTGAINGGFGNSIEPRDADDFTR